MSKIFKKAAAGFRLWLLSAVVLALMSGCGGGGGGSAYSPSPGPSPSPTPSPEPVGTTASVKYIFDLVQAKQVGAQAAIFEFRGYDSELSLIYGPIVRKRGSFASDGSIVLTEVPVSVKSLVVMMKDKDKNLCGLTQNNDVNLIAGKTKVIDRPDFSSTASELGERLKSLTVSPESVSLDIGKTADFTASGVFKCNNGITLDSDLTEVVVWKSRDAKVAEAVGGGRFRAVEPGAAKISAVLGKKSTDADISVNTPSQFVSDIHVSLKNAGLPAGIKTAIRGYGKNNKLLLAEQIFSGGKAYDFTLNSVNSKVVKVVLTVFAADGQLYACKIADVSLKYGKTYEIGSSGLLTGKELLAKAELSMTAEPQAWK